MAAGTLTDSSLGVMTISSGCFRRIHFNFVTVIGVHHQLVRPGMAFRSSQSNRGTPDFAPSSNRRRTRLTTGNIEAILVARYRSQCRARNFLAKNLRSIPAYLYLSVID